MSAYRDLYLRQFLKQTEPAHLGGCASPDLVPWGAAPDPDPAALAGTMDLDPGRALVPGTANYLYVRTTNEDPAKEHLGQLFVGAAPPALLLWPDALVPVPNAGGKPYFQLRVKPAAVGVSTDAFVYTPGSAADSLAAWVSTQDHPLALPDPPLRDVNALERWLAKPAGFAQRSVGFGLGADRRYHFVGRYEQRDLAASMCVALQCIDCKGFTVGLRPIAGGTALAIDPMVVTMNALTIFQEVELPAGFESTLDLSIDPGGPQPAQTALVHLVVYLVTDQIGRRGGVFGRSEATGLIPLSGHEWRLAPPTLAEFGPHGKEHRGAGSSRNERGASMAIVWNDLFVRTDVSEKSPLDRRGGFGSPDIIPTGLTPETPQKFITPESYGQYYNKPFQAGVPNYVYVRAKNASATSGNRGQAFLVLSNPAIVLWPGGDQWKRIKTNNGNYYSQLEPSPVGSDAVGVTTDPFVYVPDEAGHRCLVTWLSTTQHPQPDPPPKITSVEALAQFLIDNPNYAHHNIDVTPNTTGAVTLTKPFSSGTIAARWTFGLRCTGCKGFTIRFSSGTPLPNGSLVVLEPTTVNQNTQITITVDSVDVPPGWDTVFNYTYEQNDLRPENFSVVFAAFYQPPVGHPLYKHARTAHELGLLPGSVADDFRGIEVGSIGVMKGSVGGVKP